MRLRCVATGRHILDRYPLIIDADCRQNGTALTI
jgi:hypothetical protein